MQIRFSSIVSDARGSLGGVTISRNRYGAYARARTTPVNPQSARQSAIRAIIADVGSRWLSVITAVQRAAWIVFANSVPATNKLGETIHLSGYNQFVKSNVAANNAGLPDIAAAPIIFTLPGEDPDFTASVDAGTGKISIVFDDARDWVDEDNGALIVEMGSPQNASREFFDGPYRHAGIIQGDSVTPPTTPDATLDVPFAVGDGQKVWIRAKILREDGRLSDWFQYDSIVATA
jgi:hypothetical protein